MKEARATSTLLTHRLLCEGLIEYITNLKTKTSIQVALDGFGGSLDI